MYEIVSSVIIPFIGTILGASFIFLFKKMSDPLLKAFTGFAAGVMVAASFWSLILPAFESTADKGLYSFVPVSIGLWLGFLFLMLLDKIIPHMHNGNEEEGLKCNLKKLLGQNVISKKLRTDFRTLEKLKGQNVITKNIFILKVLKN